MLDGLTPVGHLFIVLKYGDFCSQAASVRGHVVEWLCSGLQIRVPRFNSGRGLQISPAPALQQLD